MVALVIALPNFIWQCTHHFIALDFLRHIHERDIRIGRTAGFVIEQFFETTNVVTVPLWILGLLYVIAHATGSKRSSLRVHGTGAVFPFSRRAWPRLLHGTGLSDAFRGRSSCLGATAIASPGVLEKNCLRNGCFVVTRRKRSSFLKFCLSANSVRRCFDSPSGRMVIWSKKLAGPNWCVRCRAFTSRCLNQNVRGLGFIVRTMVRQERLIFTVHLTGCHAQSAALIPIGHAVPGILLRKSSLFWEASANDCNACSPRWR